MEKLSPILILLSTVYLTIAHNYVCDFYMGDQSWNLSRKCIDEYHVLQSGKQNWTIVLPHTAGRSISFICVNITDVDINATKVYYSAAFFQLKVFLPSAPEEDLLMHVVALDDGY
ncbi:uncharacterized protein LOC142985500 [Anticarsia gemmatalis]|uniref:uncharacterized protein LOC142985500 n=1 Tax=Anticarsia gemmatalis TaxID=129554 RepID=UPI003F7580CC